MRISMTGEATIALHRTSPLVSPLLPRMLSSHALGLGSPAPLVPHLGWRRQAGIRGRGASCVATPAPTQGFDDEFKSTREIARGLHKRFRNVLEKGHRSSLKDFVRAGVTAYSVGCTEEGMRKELGLLQEDSAEYLRMLDLEVEEAGRRGEHAGALTLKRAIRTPEVEECMVWLTIVFITIMCCPQTTVARWATNAAVSSDSLLLWRGFCQLITKAYYTQGMAWFPIERLQMEQMVVTGRSEEAAVVADRMRLVFATLEVVEPRWGGMEL